MRPNKFRGQNAAEEWIYGSLVVDNYERTDGQKFDVAFIVEGLPCAEQANNMWTARMRRVKPETTGQFTGLLDIYGQEVYDGDIVMLDGAPCEGTRIVVYYQEAFTIATREEYDSLLHGRHPYLNDYSLLTCLHEWSNTGTIRVIGNIHENPELLK